MWSTVGHESRGEPDEALRGHERQAGVGDEGPGGEERRADRPSEDRARDGPSHVVDAGVRPGRRRRRGHHRHYGWREAEREGGTVRGRVQAGGPALGDQRAQRRGVPRGGDQGDRRPVVGQDRLTRHPVMGVTWSARSRLALKRHRTRREEGRLVMPTLGQIIREIQHAAAALPTDALRHEIEMSLEVQDAAIDLYYTIPPGGRTVEDLIIANSTVMVSVLTTALYVRELANRHADVTAVVTSLN